MSEKTKNISFPSAGYLKRSVLTALLSMVFCIGYAQFIPTPPNIDGVISTSEYGIHLDGQNQQNSGGGIWYMTWDANNLYLAVTNSSPLEGGIIYIDVDPIIPVNGGTVTDGSLDWAWDYDRTRLVQPIRSDFKFYFKGSYNEFRYTDGAGSWAANTSNVIVTSSNLFTNTIELVIPWNTITNGMGRPTSFNWFGYKMYNNGDGDNGTYHPVPNWNPITPNNASVGLINTVYAP